MPYAQANGLSAVGRFQLGVDRRYMELDGVLADLQGEGDLFVGQTLRQQLQDLVFALGEGLDEPLRVFFG